MRTIFTLLTVVQFICAVMFCVALSVHNEGTVTQTVTMLAGVVMTCDAVMEAIVRCKGMTLGYRYILGACSVSLIFLVSLILFISYGVFETPYDEFALLSLCWSESSSLSPGLFAHSVPVFSMTLLPRLLCWSESSSLSPGLFAHSVPVFSMTLLAGPARPQTEHRSKLLPHRPGGGVIENTGDHYEQTVMATVECLFSMIVCSSVHNDCLLIV
jgi:hypothetical protein